ncbi:hypothetical protein TH25_21610 [Thalassospira profundimaris]|uniref:Alpha-2-macroglobulin n=1 Tax=Thalassospira profundimaris TaxID=502049 RepID=A0A367WSQ6_9PROT|nr:MG2 domain-containing protein [Thalassospira profundimaris]RCK43482.1 hypothetical protein TH25_21610 [Thalassospira profundimaris]
MPCQKRLAALLLFVFALFLPALAHTSETYPTSFPCEQASTGIEKAVCQNADLAALDVKMAQTYQQALGTLDELAKSALQTDQRAWLHQVRNGCELQKDEKPDALRPETLHCLTRAYQNRIDDLRTELTGDLTITRVTTQADKAVSETCFAFDHDLSADQPLDVRSYIELSPARDYSARIANGKLCLMGLPHSQTTKVTLRKGLKGIFDFALAKDVSRDITIGARKAEITLGTNNYVLPKSDSPVIPITTVNQDHVALRFFRIVERNLVNTLTSNLLAHRLDNWDMDTIQDRTGEEVWAGTLDVRNVPDQDVVTQIPLREMVQDFKPGLYALVASAPDDDDRWGNKPTQWVVVTDLGLSAYNGEKGLSLQVRSLRSAAPVDGAKVTLVARNNAVLGTAVADDDGWADFPGSLLAGKGGKQALYVTAETQDGDFSFISLDQSPLELSDRGVSGHEPPGALQTYLYADRGIYRPGEKIHLGYMLRDDLSAAQTGVPVTIVLYRPDGKEAFKTVQQPDDAGGGTLDIPLANAAATGKWHISAYSDPNGAPIGDLSVQVEEFVPERLEVKASTTAPYMVFGQAMPLDVQTDYLFGAPGSGLMAGGNAFLQVDHHPFADWKNYYFGLQDDVAQVRKNFDGVKSNASGYADLRVPAFERVDLSSPLKVGLNVEVADIDGRPSRTRLSLPLQANDSLVGIRPGFDGDSLTYGQEAPFDAVVVNAKGQPLAVRKLVIDWVREERTYNWYYQNGEWQSSYDKYDVPVGHEAITADANGKVHFARSFDHWGYYRAVVRDPITGSAADHTFRVGWWANGQSPDRPDQLNMSLKSTEIPARGQIEGFIKTPFTGRLVVTVAQKNVLWRQDYELSGDGVEFHIPVDPKWGNGAYVLATAYRAGLDQQQSGAMGPVRAVAAQWVSFGKQDRTLKVGLDVPAEIRPDTSLDVPVTVTGKAIGAGEKVRVNVFAVDEGILRLTGFKAPKPEDALLGQQLLQLSYHDLYGHLITPQKGDLGVLRSGGDEMGDGNQASLKSRVFKTVALASDTVLLDGDGKGLAHFDVPDFNGKLRVFAVAYSQTAMGSGVTNMLVRAPVVADLLPPRFMAPGDQADFALRLQNLSGPDGSYKIRLATNDILTVKNPGWQGDLAPGKQAENRFDVTANRVGQGKLTLTIDGPDRYHQVRSWDMEVRPAQAWTTNFGQQKLAAGDVLNLDGAYLDMFRPETASLDVALASVPAIDVQHLITALDQYPYGCLEQITSRAFPLLSFRDAKDRFAGVTFDENNLDDKIRDGIAGVLAKQRSDGSFGLWNRQSDAEPWLTAYATDFLTTARAKGYDVLDARFNSALDWMQNVVRSEQYSPEARAYMVLVLTRNDRYSKSALDYEITRILKGKIGSLAWAQLAAARVISGGTVDGFTFDNFTYFVGDHKRYYHSYGSPLRDLAAILTLPAGIFASDNERLSLLTTVTDDAQNQHYTSTQEKAWLLQAATAIATGAGKSLTLRVNDQPAQTLQSYRVGLTPDQVQDSYRIENTGQGTAFVTWSATGIPAQPMAAASQGFSIQRQYFDMDGKAAKLDQVKTGDRFIVVLSGAAKDRLSHRALVVDLLPAGFEIEANARFPELEKRLSITPSDLSATEFIAERDDRYVAAVNLGADRYGDDKGAKFRLYYVVRAVTPGHYVHPAPFVEDMYKPAWFARGAMGNLVVSPAN